jgi:hypothetical protein
MADPGCHVKPPSAQHPQDKATLLESTASAGEAVGLWGWGAGGGWVRKLDE